MTAEESACRNVTEGTKRTKGHIILSHSAGCGSQACRCAAPCLHFMIMLQRLSCVRRTAPAHATWSLQADIPGLSHASSTGLLLSAAQWAPFSHSQWLASAPPLERRGYASSTNFDSSGPSAGLLSAIPFAVSRQEADAAFDAYHSTARNILMAKPAAGVQKVKELYLPLWVARAQGDHHAPNQALAECLVSCYGARKGAIDTARSCLKH